jgi:membrane protein DedA with SNARE-associated domain
VRHLVSLPAGAARNPFGIFSVMTLCGSALWCSVLAWFGARVLADEPRLLQDPEALVHVLKTKLLWFVVAAVVVFALYLVVDRMGRRFRREAIGESSRGGA